MCPRKQTTEPKLLFLVSFFSGEDTSYTDTSYCIHILWEVCRSVFYGPPRSHRVAARLPQEGGARTTDAEGASSRKKKPRAIIVKFCSYRKRSAVMHARRRLKGSGMGIDEALTAHNQDLLWKAKRHEKVKDAWTLDGRVTVLLAGTNGKNVKKVIRNKDELITLIHA